MGKTERRTLDFEGVVDHALNKEYPGSTGDVQTGVLAFPIEIDDKEI